MHHCRKHIREHDQGERGASAIEYALLLALIAVVVFSAVSFFGSSTGGGFSQSQECIEAAHNGTALPAHCVN